VRLRIPPVAIMYFGNRQRDGMEANVVNEQDADEPLSILLPIFGFESYVRTG